MNADEQRSAQKGDTCRKPRETLHKHPAIGRGVGKKRGRCGDVQEGSMEAVGGVPPLGSKLQGHDANWLEIFALTPEVRLVLCPADYFFFFVCVFFKGVLAGW